MLFSKTFVSENKDRLEVEKVDGNINEEGIRIINHIIWIKIIY